MTSLLYVWRSISAQEGFNGTPKQWREDCLLFSLISFARKQSKYQYQYICCWFIFVDDSMKLWRPPTFYWQDTTKGWSSSWVAVCSLLYWKGDTRVQPNQFFQAILTQRGRLMILSSTSYSRLLGSVSTSKYNRWAQSIHCSHCEIFDQVIVFFVFQHALDLYWPGEGFPSCSAYKRPG